MKVIVEISPHVKERRDTAWLMKQVVVALLPAIAASLYFFRIKALLLLVVCIVTSLVTEEAVMRLRRKPSTLGDYSALVTGILLALILPPSLPLWVAFLGAVVAIGVAKHIFGGLGQNIFNPALVGRAFLIAAFPVILTTWVEPFGLGAVSQATPLALWKFNHQFVGVGKLFMGNIPGSLGETSALALIVGGVYLFVRRVADWRAPLGMLCGMFIFTSAFYLINPANGSIVFHLCSGGAMLGMFFMVTDPVTTPVTKKGRLVFGFSVGILVIIIRMWAGLPEGVTYSILFMNAFVPLINKFTKEKGFGR